jgi:hypothetical protein
MAHPLNRARYDEDKQRVGEGYGILQPRMAVSLPGTNRSRYARLCGSEPGIDPYTRTVSDVYQDLFGEGSFIGKGIYDIDAFERSWFYSDSMNDLPLLNAVSDPVAVRPDSRLRQHALQAGWPVVDPARGDER